MLGYYHILIIFYLNSMVLRFSVVCIYRMAIIKYQLILLIDVKRYLHAGMGSMIIQLCHSGLKMRQIILTVYESAFR